MERAEPNDTKAYCIQGANGVLHVVVASERALVWCELRRPAFWQIASSSALGPARRGTTLNLRNEQRNGARSDLLYIYVLYIDEALWGPKLYKSVLHSRKERGE